MHKSNWQCSLGISLLSVCLFFGSACRNAPQESQPPEYAPIATIKDIMQGIVDPSADVVWESVATVVGPNGTEERVPRTDEEWVNVRHGAIRLVEATNLLMVPGRHVARPGEKSEAPSVELEPEQMEVLINKDREAWNGRVKALREAGSAMMKAVDAKDTNKMTDLGDQVERACEGCHLQYWYPNQVLPPGYEEPKTR